MRPANIQQTKSQRGISLIESLVAIVVMSLGILGILGIQMRTLTDTSTTLRRAQAIRLIEDLGERMKINPNAMADVGTYVTAFADTPTVGSCATGCDHTQLATYDLAVWKKAIRDNLPLGQARIFVPPAEAAVPAGQGRQLGVMVAWRENERDITDADVKKIYKDEIDATKVRAATASGTLSDGAGFACPATFTCHLQYIPVAARCAPYAPGANSPTYYCPGV
ncbi:type IV pilus modification protein PilV [Acidovorax sp. Root217]|uniref:type IV pilus modification protein PilV n=1 Tax=Acidovorax sp. Root217 TaxID=1736492 RepID=UPI00070F78B6|nr:type IV pilus modification protein PilV [Acidovorax sp. Root217]KRC23796.1 pilus assembly protein PilV [Acidovorax sp. Root217]